MKHFFHTLCLMLSTMMLCLTASAQRTGTIQINSSDLTMSVDEKTTVSCTYSGKSSDVTWSSKNTKVVQVTGSGLNAYLEAVGEGVTTVTASASSGWQTISSSITVTVKKGGGGSGITTDELPFIPTTISGGKLADNTHWYVMNIRSGKNVYAGEEDVLCSFEEGSTPEYLWAFTGSVENGFKVYNYTMGATAVLGVVPEESYDEYAPEGWTVYEGAYVRLYEPSKIDSRDATWRLSKNSNGGLTFTLVDQDYAGINDHGGHGVLRLWDSNSNLNDGGASIIITEVDPLDYGGVPLGEVVAVTSLLLDNSTLAMAAGETQQVIATILPTNATYKKVTWESNNPAVASVDANGLITAKSAGDAIITATSHDGPTAEVSVKVTLNVNTDGLYFNEVQASNVDQYMDPSYNYGSWVELYNGGSKAISLRGLFLTDDVSKPMQWGLSSLDLTYKDYSHVSAKYPPYEETSSSVPAKGFCKIWFDHNDWRYPMMCPFKLDQDGGSLYITDGSKVLAECTYPESITRASWARTTDGGSTWGWTGTPTPGESNNNIAVATQRLEAPVVDTDSKIMKSGYFSVNVTWPQGSTLRYTLDGSTPTADHGETSKDGRFNVSNTTILRLCAVQNGMMSSPVVTRSYIYTEYDETLPVMSLVTEEGNLYDSEYGIMTRGTNGRPGLGQGSRCNWNMDWDRPANIEYFDKEGKMVFNQESNIAICGGWSRAHEPYSFKVKGKKQYEHMNYLPYAFYTKKPYNKNKTLHMRNGGNDNPSNGGTGRFKDPAIQTVIISSGLNLDAQSYEPIHIYRNGKYAGLINLREPNNRDFVYANFGYDDTEVDQWEMDCDSAYVQSSGDREAFERWYDLAERCSDPAVYEELKQICDVEEFAYYMAVNCYLALGDYGYNNVKGYRPRVDHGKFRMVLFDLDSASSSSSSFSGLSSVGNYRSWNNQYEGTDGQVGTSVKGEVEFFSIFGNMLSNSAEFRKQFVDQFSILCGSVFEPKRAAAVIDSLLANVQEAASHEGVLTGQSLYPESVASSLKSSYFSDSRISNALNGLASFSRVREETSGSKTNVALTQSDPRGRLYLNGISIPTGYLTGRVFTPAVLRAEAPAGKKFAGWKGLGEAEDKPEAQTAFPMNDKDWYYYDLGSLDNENWTAKTYSDAAWQTGTAPLGYSKNVEMATETSRDVITTYFRKYFNLKETPAAASLSYKADDGFAVYINGQEAGRYDLKADATYDTYADSYAGDFFSGELTIDPALFVKGSNVIAIEVHNSSATSSDIVWDANLSYVPAGEETTPEEARFLSTDPEYTIPEGSKLEVEAVYVDKENEDEGKTYPVKLNEVSAANSIYVNDYFKKDDWVELYNTTDKDIDLTGYYLTDNVENLTKFRIDETDVKDGNILPAHGFRLVWCSKLGRTGKEIHANFKLANDEGAYVILSNPDQTWADTLTYQPMNGDETCGRYPDGTAGSYIMQIPTISLPNRLTMYADLYEQSIVGQKEEPVDPVDPVDPPVDPVGIRLISQSNELGINYSRGQLNVTNEYFLPTTLRVYRANGVEVLSADLDMSEGRAAQSTSNLTPGTYVATATDSEGEKVSTKFNVK